MLSSDFIPNLGSSKSLRKSDCFSEGVQRYYSTQNILTKAWSKEWTWSSSTMLNKHETAWIILGSQQCWMWTLKIFFLIAKLFFFQTNFWLPAWSEQMNSPLFLTVLFQIHFSSALLLHILFRLTLNVIIIPTISFTVIYDFIKALRFLFRFLLTWVTLYNLIIVRGFAIGRNTWI